MSKVIIGSHNANITVNKAFETALFPLKMKFTNLMPRKLVLPEIEGLILDMAGTNKSSMIVTVSDYGTLQRLTSSIQQLAELSKLKNAIEIESIVKKETVKKAINNDTSKKPNGSK